MRRVWVINQWLPPDPAPTAVLCGEVIDLLRAAGYELVLLSRHRGGEAAAAKPGIVHIQVDHLANGPTGIGAKLASWPLFAWRAWRVLRRELRATDVVLVCSDPPLFYPLAIAAARRCGARVIHWSQDVYPDVVQRHWPNRWLSMALAPLRAWRNAALRRADRVVVISPGMASLMQAAGARTTLIANWARDDRVQARELGASALRQAHFSSTDFVLAYSGNLGRVHEFATLLAAAKALADERNIKFLVVGSGPRLAELRVAVADAALDSFCFLPLQPEQQLTDTLAAGDVHLVSLRPEFESLVLPSKVYGIAAVGRALLFCGDVHGETAELIRAHDCGVVSAAGDGLALAAQLRALAQQRALCAELGRNARRMIDSGHSRAEALAKWRALVDEVAGLS